jgi:hypothetical protein
MDLGFDPLFARTWVKRGWLIVHGHGKFTSLSIDSADPASP